MVDYSKFDKLASELSDSDDAPGPPRVTRLKAGSKVTVGPTGAVVAEPGSQAPVAPRPAAKSGIDYSRWDSVGADDSADEDAYEYDDELGRPSAEEEVQRLEKRPVEAATAAQPAARVAKPQQRCRSSDLSRNGAAVGDAYVWSQTATEVTLSVRVPPGTRARDVTVSLSRHAADKNHSVRVTVNGQTALDNELAFPIDVPHSSNPDDGGSAAALPGVAPDTAAAEDVDWALDDFDAEASDAPRRVVRVTMRKAGIRGASETGVVLWWNKCFRDHPEERNIDTSALADRHAASQRTQQARKAWQEAEAMFLARVKQGPQHTIIED